MPNPNNSLYEGQQLGRAFIINFKMYPEHQCNAANIFLLTAWSDLECDYHFAAHNIYIYIYSYKSVQKFANFEWLHVAIFHILRYFVTKRHNFAKLMMLFSAVAMNFPNSKLRLTGGPLNGVSPKEVPSIEITLLLFISGYCTSGNLNLLLANSNTNTCCYKYFCRSWTIQFNSQRHNNARLTTKELISIEGTFLGAPCIWTFTAKFVCPCIRKSICAGESNISFECLKSK